MSTILILGIALIVAIYNIIMKCIALKEWNMKYGIEPVKERRSDKWDLY